MRRQPELWRASRDYHQLCINRPGLGGDLGVFDEETSAAKKNYRAS
jgi:hypothetical protein